MFWQSVRRQHPILSLDWISTHNTVHGHVLLVLARTESIHNGLTQIKSEVNQKLSVTWPAGTTKVGRKMPLYGWQSSPKFTARIFLRLYSLAKCSEKHIFLLLQLKNVYEVVVARQQFSQELRLRCPQGTTQYFEHHVQIRNSPVLRWTGSSRGQASEWVSSLEWSL